MSPSPLGGEGWGEGETQPHPEERRRRVSKDRPSALTDLLPGPPPYRRRKSFRNVPDLWRSGVSRACLERLAAADAFRSMGLDRRQALWEVRGLPKEIPLPLFEHADAADTGAEQHVTLPIMPLPEHVVNDYRTLRLSLKAHPMSFLRERAKARRILSCADLKNFPRRIPRRRCRRRAGAPTPWLGGRRRVHDHRGRDRRGQFGDLAQGT